MTKAEDGKNKRSPQKRGAKKVSKKGAVIKSELQAIAETTTQACLSLTTAAFIVGGCLPPGSHGNDDTLEETGLITDPLRRIFRECVFNGVVREGCDINKSRIPNAADTKVGEVIIAVFQNSH